MADTSTKRRPLVRTPRTAEVAPAPKETRRPPPERPRRFVRWIEYAAIVLILGAAAVIGVLMLRGGGEEAAVLDVEAGSSLTLGERNTNPDFAVDWRWAGVSGVTLEEFEAMYESFNQRYEAESGLAPLVAAAIPVSPVSYGSYAALREAGAIAALPVTPVSYGSYAALREAGAIAALPVTPVSYGSYAALREAGAIAALPVTPVSYGSYAALREAGAIAALPVTPVSYGSYAALREAGAIGALPAPRFLGESDMTLEEFEATFDTFATQYEAESGLSMGARHTDADFAVDWRWAGVSGVTLEEFELSE